MKKLMTVITLMVIFAVAVVTANNEITISDKEIEVKSEEAGTKCRPEHCHTEDCYEYIGRIHVLTCFLLECTNDNL